MCVCMYICVCGGVVSVSTHILCFPVYFMSPPPRILCRPQNFLSSVLLGSLRHPSSPTPTFFRRIISVRWCPWLSIFLFPAPSAPLFWLGWEGHICSFPSCVESWRCQQPGAWGLQPTSSPFLGRRTQNSAGRGEPVSADRQLPQSSLAAASAANSFCNLLNRPEDGALDPEVTSQGLWLFPHLNWSQIRLLELLVVTLSLLLLLYALTTHAHSHESTTGAGSLESGKWRARLSSGLHPWP